MVSWHLTVDANDPGLLARFWAPQLGYEMQPPPDGHASWKSWYLSLGEPEEDFAGLGDDYCDRIHDPTGGGPRIWFQIVPERKTQKNRLHFDLYPTGRDPSLSIEERQRIVEARVTELILAGATVNHRMAEGDHYHVVMHDPEGNEFCVA